MKNDPVMNDPAELLAGGKTGILLLHDVGGSAADMRPLARALHRRGFTVASPQLMHAASPSNAKCASAAQLVGEAEHALARLKSGCDSVIVAGRCYGAMLALELARHDAAKVQAVAMIEPRAWVPGLPRLIPSAIAGHVKQSWVAAANRLAGQLKLHSSVASGTARHQSDVALIADLLDSVHSGLVVIKQPVMLIHDPSRSKSGRDGSFMLQRRLGGRVESVMLELQLAPGIAPQRSIDALAERIDRFTKAIVEEVETRRGNELRRKRLAANRGSVA